MKTEISRDSHQPERRYSGVYQQQGRMLTDADWNELVEILKERLNDALRGVVGDKAGSMGGTPRHRALKVVHEAPEIFKIKPGHIYVDGVAAQIPGDTTILYEAQPDFPSPPDPTGDHVLYADVWERTVTHLMDERLRDKGLHGADTCTRKQMMAQVKWCPAAIDPEQSDKNPPKGDAELSLELLHKTAETDPCDPCAAQLDVESKVGNYLFRVEVHDVKGDANSPTEITLKWSSENGAEQFEALSKKEEMPAGFITNKWVYEFFDMTSEKHLGVHFGASPWEPVRGVLEEIKEAYSVPTIPGSSETEKFVRRWDGYCRLDLSSKTLIEGMDRGVALSTTKDSDAPGYVEIGTSLHINLSSINLDLALGGKKFVAGDYWLADVREAEHDPLDPEKSTLIEGALPNGIEHHYLTLGKVVGGALQPNPEADRKYAFPPLTEMTRMFIAGGDGQEVVPGDPLKPLPQPLRVAVANGEWPVAGATVRFQAVAADESLAPLSVVETNSDGIAEYVWTPDAAIGDECRVRATLVNPDHPGDASMDMEPPVYFCANLVTADQVAYDPGCETDAANTVHKLLVEDTSTPPDQLILGTDGYYTVQEVLDALLCRLKATHLPLDKSDEDLCADFSAAQTVQDALKVLCDRPTGTGGGCKTSVGDHGEFPTIEEAIDALRDRYTVGVAVFNLCLLPGEHDLPSQQFFDDLRSEFSGLFSLLLYGAGMESTFLKVAEPVHKLGLEMHTFYAQNLTIVGGNEDILYLTLHCEQIHFNHVNVDVSIQDAANAALILDGREQVHVTDCIILAHHNSSFSMPQSVFENIGILADPFSDNVVFVRTEFMRTAWETSIHLAQPHQAGERQDIANQVQATIDKVQLTAEETRSYERLITSLTIKEIDIDAERFAQRLVGDLDRVRFAAASAAASRDPGMEGNDQVVAVVIESAQADCLFDHNDIIGQFSIYGMPPWQSFELSEIKGMHGRLFDRIQYGDPVISFASTQRKLQLRNNHLTQLLVAESVIEELNGYVGEGGTVEGVFETVLLSDNVFRAANNFFVARGHSFTATRFDHVPEDNVDETAGIVIGDNAVYVGTAGKSERVDFGEDGIDPNIKLYDTTLNPREFYQTESATFRLQIVRSMPH